MIQAVAFCPHPPVLVPALAGTAAAETSDLLTACDSALARLLLHRVRVVVVGSADRTARFDVLRPGGLGDFGGAPADGFDSVSYAEDPALPLSLAIGRWLVQRADPGQRPPIELWGIGPNDLDSDIGTGTGPDIGIGSAPAVVLVMGDGTARRGLKAPGYLDDRAAAFDAQITEALAVGDAAALTGLDAALGRDLLAAGVPAWRAAGRLLDGTRWHGHVDFSGDPFGVQYTVATWTPEPDPWP